MVWTGERKESGKQCNYVLILKSTTFEKKTLSLSLFNLFSVYLLIKNVKFFQDN